MNNMTYCKIQYNFLENIINTNNKLTWNLKLTVEE